MAAIVWLTSLLNHIEAGGQWPDSPRIAKCAHVAKTPELSLDALQYRGLTLLPSVYRLWGKLRLRHLRGWQESWCVPELHAG
eukprot:5285378-Alexandrium_andersonii.AAC.1